MPRAVGMEISFGLLFAKFRLIMGGIALLIAGKVAIMGAVGQVRGAGSGRRVSHAP